MADKKSFSMDQLQALLNRVSEGDLSPGNIAKKYGTKDAVDKKAAELLSFLEEHKPDIKDKQAFDTWSSVKNRLSKQMSTGKKYANTLPNQGVATNLDTLNEGKSIKVAAQDPAARILEQEASQIDPLRLKEAQRSLGGSATPNIMDIQNVDIAAAKRAALEGKKLVPKAKVGGGKLGALMAMGTLGYQALKGEPVMAQDVLRSGGELLNPLPISIEELGQEQDKIMNAGMDKIYEAQAKQQAEKDLEKAAREEASRPEALEFGQKLEEMQQNQQLESGLSPRMSEIKRRLNPYR